MSVELKSESLLVLRLVAEFWGRIGCSWAEVWGGRYGRVYSWISVIPASSEEQLSDPTLSESSSPPECTGWEAKAVGVGVVWVVSWVGVVFGRAWSWERTLPVSLLSVFAVWEAGAAIDECELWEVAVASGWA